MMCKDCRNRDRLKWCPVIKQHVPKKVRQDGTNPALACGRFNPKRPVKKEAA